jgi:hypothetical protein
MLQQMSQFGLLAKLALASPQPHLRLFVPSSERSSTEANSWAEHRLRILHSHGQDPAARDISGAEVKEE